jgi:hypothetical protein
MSDLLPTAADTLGPPPFRFTPSRDPLVCNAFSLPFKLLTVGIVSYCGWWLWMLWSSGKLGSSATVGGSTTVSNGLVWLIAAMALMLITAWFILTSKTTLTSQRLHQSFVWDKHLELRELAYVKLIRVPGLDWLIAPRLYCRTLLGKFAVFYAADVQMINEWQRLQRELKACRNF